MYSSDQLKLETGFEFMLDLLHHAGSGYWEVLVIYVLLPFDCWVVLIEMGLSDPTMGPIILWVHRELCILGLNYICEYMSVELNANTYLDK